MESVYNLIPQSNSYTHSSFSYTSRYNEQTKNELNASKSPGKLFGPKGGVKPDPKRFTKKGKGETLRQKTKVSVKRDVPKQTVLCPAEQPRLPKEVQSYVPRHTEKATIAPRSDKKYVTENRKAAVTTSPRKVVPTYIDKPSGKGSRHDLEASGMTMAYSQKPTYGKTPAYLETRKAELAAQRDAALTSATEAGPSSSVKQLSEDERQQILAGLRQNWDTLHREYQGLSMFTDTVPKKAKRNAMEAQLNQLEADINRFESHKIIYVDMGR